MKINCATQWDLELEVAKNLAPWIQVTEHSPLAWHASLILTGRGPI